MAQRQKWPAAHQRAWLSPMARLQPGPGPGICLPAWAASSPSDFSRSFHPTAIRHPRENKMASGHRLPRNPSDVPSAFSLSPIIGARCSHPWRLEKGGGAIVGPRVGVRVRPRLSASSSNGLAAVVFARAHDTRLGITSLMTAVMERR